ncbi:MAG: hypothetical protein H3C48_16220 [Chitinophagaceae bacterium]|nr:hypothetical protein [Chitinophagaceae bacterium]
MLENLLDLVKQYAGDSIINNPAIPNDKNEAAIGEAANAISGGLQNMLNQGGFKDILKMFGGQSGIDENNITHSISGGLIESLTGKLGVEQQAASGIAGSLIPAVLKGLVQRTNDPNDAGFNIQGLFNSLSGGKTAGIDLQGMLSKVQGGMLDLDGDGDTDLQDIMRLFNQMGTGGSGGLIGKLKGLFGG